ncbi:hypothetical protein CFVI03293_A0105 (plasmid) [Campylobacter fetus subsp. venerealis cfvi03/293]|nr:hypothetical protein CFVI03293_A0105 [Campylobacter fetus subsp. venerealis cfvi03/293]
MSNFYEEILKLLLSLTPALLYFIMEVL